VTCRPAGDMHPGRPAFQQKCDLTTALSGIGPTVI
jgi:hypothetical protein